MVQVIAEPVVWTTPAVPAITPLKRPGRSAGEASTAPLRSPEEEDLLLRLATDRLRELQDDGVTFDYIGRMYDVSGAEIRKLYGRLRALQKTRRQERSLQRLRKTM